MWWMTWRALCGVTLRMGIELVGLTRPNLRYIPRHLLESYEVYRVLRSRPFHVIHFHDYQARAYTRSLQSST